MKILYKGTNKKEELISLLGEMGKANVILSLLSDKASAEYEFEHTSLYVMAIIEHDLPVAELTADFSGFIKNKLSDCTVVQLPDKETYVAIKFLVSMGDKVEFVAQLREAQRTAMTESGTTITITASPVYKTADGVNEQLFKLIRDSGYRVIAGMNSFIDTEFMNRFDGIISDEFFSCFFGFYNCLKVGNRELVDYNLEEMKKYVVNRFAPDVFRLAYINIVHCFSQYLSDEILRPYLEEFPETVELGFEKIAHLSDLCFKNFYCPSEASEYLKNEVLNMVETDFSNPLLSVSMIADSLGISTSYLSRYFREKTGVTLFSYIDEIRITNAKQMLLDTTLPVKDIVKAVGYNDINNFNRKFKAKTGKTPSVYRKK